MDGEIINADLRHPTGSLSPAKRQHAAVVCPHWHQILLKASVLELLLLLLLLVGFSVCVFQKTARPASAPQLCPETRGRKGTELSDSTSIEEYFCQSTRNSSAAPAACLLCPLFWKLLGDRCYRLSTEKGIWTRAREECENEQSQLVVLRDKAEQDYLQEIAGPEVQPVWLGLKASKKEWQWVDGSSFSTAVFGQLPAMHNHCGTFKNTRLEEDICTGEHQWICQKEPLRLHP
ncbi:killer cell lectin-like receptor subfamily B member 1F isoform X2 [Numida meleagris]|uniref:killer cell lectin-like receptor subfamily B member 1F isoform X2 n=1 Tax=Numida meleagris TaxID=8996 RepID=UPI000B3E240B|nr:killer cell lectin-like receptor subfamily B member 1F isoform X2 [Numida meleagris]